jgi:multiple sugar transport system substrate-binding protein
MGSRTRVRGRAPRSVLVTVAMGVSVVLAGCGVDTGTADGPTEITMWSHSAGNPAELEVINRIIADFNASQDEYVVDAEFFPQGAYNDAIVAAATADDLPCLLDMDGPVMPNWAWAEVITPLELPEELTDQFLPSTVGEWEGEIYSIGYWDAALSVLARRSVLEDNGIRIPTMERPWSFEEFDEALVTLKEAGFEYAIDMGVADTGEWWSYAYSPLLQSFGGDLIDRDTFLSADAVLNGPEAVAFGEWFHSLFERDLASRTPTAGRQDFPLGNVALSWNGNWSAPAAFEAFGDDVLFLPPPDFGAGPKIGGASWQWGASANCDAVEGARDYIEFSLAPEYIAEFSNLTGLIPATEEAAALTDNYAEAGPLAQMLDYSREYAVIRPPTPAYAVISSVFEKTLQDVMNGADAQGSLDRAVDQIDFNIETNNGYGF